MWRSLLAVIVGYLAATVIVVLGILLAAALLVPGGLVAAMSTVPQSELPASYLAANLIVSFVAALAGGLIAARIAVRSKRTHVLAFAGLLVALAVISWRGGPQPGQPDWYPWGVALAGVAGAMAAWFLAKDTRR